jgi:hypothetical protein
MHREALDERRERRSADTSIRVEHDFRLAPVLGAEVPRRDLLRLGLEPLVGRALARDARKLLRLAVDALLFAFCDDD